MTHLLRDAEDGGYAVMAVDFLSKHMLELELEVAEGHNAPLIVVSPPLPIGRLERYKSWTRSVLGLCERAKVPVSLHLDDGKSVKTCLAAIDAGFTSVMIDHSLLPSEENVRMTRTVVEAARKTDVSPAAAVLPRRWPRESPPRRCRDHRR